MVFGSLASVHLPVKRLTETATIPTKKNPLDAGWDLYVDIDKEWYISSGSTVKISTGIAVAVPPGYEVQIRTRSGMAVNYGLCILNSPGTIDCGYLGDISLIIHNSGQSSYIVKPGERLAQMVLKELPTVVLQEVDELPVYGTRGADGFGSSGK